MVHAVDILQVELTVDTAAIAREASDRVSSLSERKVRPLIAKLFEAADDPIDPVRLDNLVVDLGRISSQRFDEDFLSKLEAALPAALAREIGRRSRASSVTAAALESVEIFIRTGCVPWWEDVGDEHSIARALRQAAAVAPSQLLEMVATWVHDDIAVARLAAHFDRETLEALATYLGREACAAMARAVALLERALNRVPPPHQRSSWKLALWECVVVAVAKAPWGSASAALGALLHEAVQRQPAVARYREASDSADVDWPPELREALATAGTPRSYRQRRADDAVASTASRAVEGSTPHQSAARVRSGETSPDAEWPTLRPVFESPAVLSVPQLEIAASTRETAASRERVDQKASIARRGRRGARVLSRLDHVYVANAGLVLLWPFYRRFFERLELLDASGAAFASPDCASIAAHTLDLLATEDEARPEFRLALAKLLSGLDPDADVELSEPLRPESAEECEYLLESVIEQAKDLGVSNPAAFREAFLARRGAISTRDGCWLLQVERREHDVLLRRLRWSWSWVKLPWMIHPLRVEW
ncbi:MAG: hypothetical protein JNK04_00770 [Myxococcales bacterium]|nr:hypothetical protein [Myxococcales bacterium]